MKKVLLLATLLGGVSFASKASGMTDKKQEILVVRAVTQNFSSNNAGKLQASRPNACGWVSYSVACGETFLGHSYVCSIVDVYHAKMALQDAFCN